MKKRIFLASPHMGGLEEGYVKEAFDTNWIAPLGPNVNKFEEELSEFVKTKASAAVSAGTAAIHLAMILLGIKRDDYVFCSDLTFCASCNPIIYEGAKPVFIDSEPSSWNMSPLALEKAFVQFEKEGNLPKAVVIVNLYGQSADMDKLKGICNSYNVPIIEDAAESLGASYKGKMSGTLGDFGIYSFNGNKIITTSGGGMLISSDEEAIKKARYLSTQAKGNERYYHHTELGYNYRMSNLVAGVGRGQLKILKERIKQKENIYKVYKEAFKDIKEIEMMPIQDYGESNYWLTCITLSKESKVKPLDIILALEEDNIEARYIWKPMHMQPYYNGYRFFSHNEKEDESISRDIFERGLCLPSDTKMTTEDLDRVIKIVKDLFN